VKRTIIGILLVPIGLLAQQSGPAWTNIGPSPDAVEAIAVDPHGGRTILLGGDASGVRKSVDGGINWSTSNTGLTNLEVQALAFDASGMTTIYAGSAGGGLFRSDDGGDTWRNLAPGLVGSVAADPNRPGFVYATFYNNLANGSLRKSLDGGATWTTIFPTTAAIFNITIDPTNPDILYIPTVGHGAFKSTDGGQHWSSMSALTPQAIWTIVLDSANSQVLYAGTNQDGIWKSTDAGNTWQLAGSPGPFPVNSLIVDSSGAHTLYAGTNGGGVWTSSDGGASWQPTGISSGMVWSLALDSTGALFAGTNAAGAQVSRDRGATWTVLDTGIDAANKFGYGIWIDPGNSRKMLVSSELGYGAVWSQDGGASWSMAGQGFTAYGSRGMAFDPSDSRLIYAGGMVGDPFFKSTDGGQRWSVRRFGTAAVYVIAVAVDPLSPNIIYAGTQNEGVFKSTDHGDTWKSVGTGLSGAITFLTPDPSKSGRLFASTATAFYLSEDGGQSWTNIMNVPAWTVAIDPNSPLTVYATARTQGAFRTSDGGHTWQSINNGITSLSMGRNAPVIIDPTSRQTLYVGSDGGVYKSLDGGDHWFAVNSGLADLSVTGLAMDPHNPALLYASGPSGVFKTVTGAEVQTPSVSISSIANAASYSRVLASQSLAVITGAGLGPPQLVAGSLKPGGSYSTQLSGTTVQFGATSAPVIYTSASQVAVLIPDFAPGSSVQVTVTYEGRTSAPYMVGIVPSAPGIFTLDDSGQGQAVALNQDGSLNSASNPAKAGDPISLFATGIGAGQATLSIGGVDGISTTVTPLSPGAVRIDARIPTAIQAGAVTPVMIRAAGMASQPGVTVAVVAPPVQAQQYVIATYAGGGLPPSGIAGVNAPIAWATAVTADSAGNIYFVSSLNCVFKVDPQGMLTRVAGTSRAGYSGDGGPAVDAQLFTTDVLTEEPQFGYPGGIVADGSGNVYISDSGNHRVRKVSPAGVITTIAGNGTPGYSGDDGPATGAQLMYPAGLAVDAAGNIYIADVTHIRKVLPNGVITTVLTVNTTALGLAVDKSGNLYFAGGPNVRKVSPDGTVTLVAGNGQIGDGGDGGPASSAQLIGPSSVALDNSGNVYIADVSRVRKVSPDGIISSVAGVAAPGTGMPLTIESISLDNSGSLYIAGDFFVLKLPPNGLISAIAGNGGSADYGGDGGQALNSRLNAPTGVAVDASGNLYIADSGNYRVRKVSTAGVITTVAGNGTPGYSGDGGPATRAQLTWPLGLAVDSAGNLYIGDGTRVRKVLADDTILTVAGNGLPFGPGGSAVTGDGGPATAAQLTVPSGLAVDSTGSLYILDTENNRVRKVSQNGIITTFAGNGVPGYSGDGGPATSAQLGITNQIHGINPTGLAFDGNGNLYITDDGNVRIRKVSPGGIITTFAGSGRTLGYSGDGGLATQAQMSFPSALAADTGGNVFIGESTRVRKVSPDGNIATVAGSPSGTSGYSGDGLDATKALIGYPSGLAVDSRGNIYIADPNHNVIRVLLPGNASGAARPGSAFPKGTVLNREVWR
jgi:uncharacterized protein (TIGR03437 family)